MGGAQPLAITMNGGVALCVEVDPHRIERRLETGYVMDSTDDLDEALRLGRGKPVLGLADKRGVGDEGRDQRAAAGQEVIAGDISGLLVADKLAVGLHAFQDRVPERVRKRQSRPDNPPIQGGANQG